nr:unnamed protein product [Callosobruchus analis]
MATVGVPFYTMGFRSGSYHSDPQNVWSKVLLSIQTLPTMSLGLSKPWIHQAALAEELKITFSLFIYF